MSGFNVQTHAIKDAHKYGLAPAYALCYCIIKNINKKGFYFQNRTYKGDKEVSVTKEGWLSIFFRFKIILRHFKASIL